MSTNLNNMIDIEKKVNADHTLTYYSPDLQTVNSKQTTIQVSNSLKSFTLPGKHTSETCALNASIYDSNTKFQEKIDITNKVLTQKSGFHYIISYTKKYANETGMTKNPGIIETNNIETEKLNFINKITWVGYFQPISSGTYTFDAKNVTVYIGASAFHITSKSEKVTTQYTVSNVNDASIPIRIIYKHNPKNKNTDYSLKITKDGSSILRDEIFSLFKGCNFHYRSPVLYYLEGNTGAKDGTQLKDENLTCKILGQLDRKNERNPSIINTPFIANSGVPIKQEVKSRNIFKKIGRFLGKKTYKTIGYTVLPTNKLIPKKKLALENKINTDGIEYTNHKTHVALNNATGNPLIGQYSITNNNTNESQFIPSNNKVLNYNSTNYIKTMGNTFPNTGQPYGDPTRIKLTSTETIGSCLDNMKNKETRQNGFHMFEDKNGKYCISNGSAPLTYLPAQTSQFNKSNAYTTMPKITQSDFSNNITINTIVNRDPKNMENISFSSTSIYNKTKFPDPNETTILKNNNKTTADKISSSNKQSFTTIEGLGTGIIGVSTVNTTPNTTISINNDNADTLKDTEININSPAYDELSSTDITILHHALEKNSDTDKSIYAQRTKAIVKRLLSISKNNNKQNVAVVKWKDSIKFTGEIPRAFENIRLESIISLETSVNMNLVSSKVTCKFQVFNLSSPTQHIIVTLESYNKVIKVVTVSIKNTTIDISGNKRNTPNTFNFSAPVPPCCSKNKSWIDVVCIINPKTNNLIVKLNGKKTIDKKIDKGKLIMRDFNKITLGSNTIKEGSGLSNTDKGLIGGGAAALLLLGPIGWAATIGVGIAAAILKTKKKRYRDTILLTDFKVKILANAPETFSNINNIDPMVSSYSFMKESFTNYKEGMTDAQINNFKQQVDRYNSLNASYQKKLDTINENSSAASTNWSIYKDNLTKQSIYNDNNGGVLFKKDDNGQIVPRVTNYTAEIVKHDLNELIIQQNTIYVTGTIACATLLIAAIMIGSK